jgi:hypothetical protein
MIEVEPQQVTEDAGTENNKKVNKDNHPTGKNLQVPYEAYKQVNGSGIFLVFTKDFFDTEGSTNEE